MLRPSVPVHRLKRRAKTMARTEAIPLHAALDRVAREEGFAAWSLLASRSSKEDPPRSLLPDLREGDLLLLGARPGQGKTRAGLRLLIDAARDGRRAVLFTLEYTEAEAIRHIQALRGRGAGPVEVVASDDVCAELIARRLAAAPPGTVAVIDYLQILDQRRRQPPLAEQMEALRGLARARGLVLAFISQIDRAYDPARDPVPGLGDVRLPNPLDVRIFSKACFLHAGAMRLLDVA